MQRRLLSLLLCGTSLAGLYGCASHRMEQRVVNSFIQSLEKEDLAALGKVSSEEFQQTALAHSSSAKALKIVNIPTGEFEVLNVKETSKTEKRVLVGVGEKNRQIKLYYDLVRDPQTRKWVVDDIQVKQRLKPGEVNKSVTEQMELLLCIQEFLDAWESGDRQQILATSTPDLKSYIEPLPPSGLKRFTSRVSADLDAKRMKPKIDGHANMAVVTFSTKSGSIVVTMRETDRRWLADDLAVESRREGMSISSLRKQSLVMQTATKFCQAYESGDKAALSEVCTGPFFRFHLEPSDLTKVPLPPVKVVEEEMDLKLVSTQAEVIFKHKDQYVQLTLTQGRPTLGADGTPTDDESQNDKPFKVEEVTLHDLKTAQNKRLSAIFSSQYVVQNFAQALGVYNLKGISMSATTDFNNRVWNRVELEQLAELPLDKIENQAPEVLDTHFDGALTEVTVNQGGTPLTYVLREQGGMLKVDDVLVPSLDDFPTSLKQTLEVVIPFNSFRNGLASNSLENVRMYTSREFNKLVFQSMNRLPTMKQDPVPYLDNRINRMQLTADRALMVLGDEHYGAKVFMTKENETYVVDDVVLVSGIQQADRTGLKQAMRHLVVSGTIFSQGIASQKQTTERTGKRTAERTATRTAARTGSPRTGSRSNAGLDSDPFDTEGKIIQTSDSYEASGAPRFELDNDVPPIQNGEEVDPVAAELLQELELSE